jgi:YVTN family beta-propeller protein
MHRISYVAVMFAAVLFGTASIPVAAAASTTIDVGGGSLGALVSPDGEQLYVPVDVHNESNQSIQGHVAFIDTETNTVTTRVPVGVLPTRITSDPGGSRLYVPNNSSGTITVINAKEASVTATINVGGNPTYATFVPGLSRLLVTSGSSGELIAVDTRSNSVSHRVKLGGYAWGLSLTSDSRFALVTNIELNRLDVIDTRTLNLVAQVPTGIEPARPVLTPNGHLALISNYGESSVTVVDTRSFQMVRTIAVGNAPTPPVISPSGRWAWITNADDDTVMRIDLTKVRGTSNPVSRTVEAGEEPWALLLNASGSTLYVANRMSAGLTVICSKAGIPTRTLGTSNPNRWLTAGPAIYAGGTGPVIDVVSAAPLKRDRCR